MHPLLDKYICEKYPKIFIERNDKKSCMSQGLEIGDGWFTMFDSLCKNIQSHIDRSTSGGHPQVIAKQVKEKFSSLRFYYEGGDNYIHALVDQAEDLSTQICEKCGIMDSSVGRNEKGWIKTTCKKHAVNPDDFNNNFEFDDKLKEIFKSINNE